MIYTVGGENRGCVNSASGTRSRERAGKTMPAVGTFLPTGGRLCRSRSDPPAIGVNVLPSDCQDDCGACPAESVFRSTPCTCKYDVLWLVRQREKADTVRVASE